MFDYVAENKLHEKEKKGNLFVEMLIELPLWASIVYLLSLYMYERDTSPERKRERKVRKIFTFANVWWQFIFICLLGSYQKPLTSNNIN